MNDIELMQGIQDGDQHALEMLYEQYGGPVFSLALHILNNHALAEEVTQDVFLRVWEQALKWDSNKGKLISWLLQITRFRAIDRIRSENRKPALTETSVEDMPNVASRPAHVDSNLWADGQLLREFIGRLPNDQQEVIQMAYFYGMTHSEIADSTGLPLGTVKSRLRLGLQKLRTIWEQEAVGT